MTPHRETLTRAERSERLALALMVGLGALLMLVASSARGGELPYSATRTDRFNATLRPHATVRIDNVSGDIVAAPGKTFTVVVTTTTSASTQKRADELLSGTTILQTNDDDGYALETTSRWWRDEPGHRRYPSHVGDVRITAKYEVTVPPGLTAILRTVNGAVTVHDVDGDLDVSTVNGNVQVAGARRSFKAHTVNGRVEALAAQLPPTMSVNCGTVNGAVSLTLPKDARFDLSASSMSGGISSTFPLPARTNPEALPVAKEKEKSKDKEREHARSGRRIVVRDPDEGEIVVDLSDVELEIEQSMREVEVEVQRAMERVSRETRVLPLLPGRSYSGSIGQGGAPVRVSTLNGSIAVLAAGSQESDAKPLVSVRRGNRQIVMMPMTVVVPRVDPEPAVPPVRVVVPRAPAPPRPPRSWSDDESVVRGDISGDFLSTTGGASYKVGKVSGRVLIQTRGGEIHVASAGAAADLQTTGGDIKIGPVGGELKALTMAGDVRAGLVGGAASIRTSGGDIRIEGVRGALEARTAGGDVIVPSVAGGAEIETGGGDVKIGFAVPQAAISIRNAGGDVTLSFPKDFRGEFELVVTGSSPDETAIRSDFPEIAVTKQSGSQRAAGSVNGGGPKVVVRTSSGTIRIRRS